VPGAEPAGQARAQPSPPIRGTGTCRKLARYMRRSPSRDPATKRQRLGITGKAYRPMDRGCIIFSEK